MAGGPVPPAFFQVPTPWGVFGGGLGLVTPHHHCTAPTPRSQPPQLTPKPPPLLQPFMSPRYPGGPRPPLRMPNQVRRSLPGAPSPKKRGAAPPPQHPDVLLPPFLQPPVGVPGSQPLLPNAMDPAARSQGEWGVPAPLPAPQPGVWGVGGGCVGVSQLPRPSPICAGHPGMGGPMQRMNPPRGMAGMGPQVRDRGTGGYWDKGTGG